MQELSMNVLDIAQNSVRAGATRIGITVDVDTPADRLTITVSDNGSGMSADQLKRVADPFFTTRTTRKVGLGIPLFKMAAEMTGGTFRMDSEQGTGTTVTAVFGYSHIDRMPLGDMPETVCHMICLNESIDITYVLRVDGKVFSASTAEFKEILEGLPLNMPQVMQFIRQYLAEHSDELFTREDTE